VVCTPANLSFVVNLTAHFLQELPSVAATGQLTKEQLVTVVNWKLTRGKFRPLMNQVLSNSEKVREARGTCLPSLQAI
jgi:hypothetical protein